MKARVGWPLGVMVVTGLYALIPLLGSHEFYMRGDTAAQFAPTWLHLGDLVRDGQWPPFLDPSQFAGGNYAAEALYGIFNPLNLLIFLLMSWTSNLIVGVTIVKASVLVVLSLGTYRLARDYGAARWAAAIVATALPFSGFTLYWDAGSWPSGLIALTYTVWVWWAFRRCLRGTLNPAWALLVGALAITQGNPYGTLGVVVVGAAVLVEGAASRNTRGMVRVLVTGVGVALFLPLVYLPLMETSHLASRSNLGLLANTGMLRPGLGDLFGLSSPTFVPGIKAITGPMLVPATYFSWMVLPLLPWLRYEVFRRRVRELSGLAVAGVGFLLLTLGPSQLWLFRWPLRLLEYTWLAVGVAFAVAISQGLRRDHFRGRVLATAGLVAAAGWLSASQRPDWHSVAVVGPVLLVALSAVVLGWHHARPDRHTGLALLAIAGTGLVLLSQSLIFHENESSRVWHVPSNVEALQHRFGDLDGRVMQFADLRRFQEPGKDQQLRAQWQEFLPGSMYDAAGVDAVNSYTGMGYRPFERRLCLHYEGFTRACGYRNVWKPVAGTGGPILADLLKLDTVVVGSRISVGVTPAPGWRTVSSNGKALVLKRTTANPWPGSNLSWASPGLEVSSARTTGRYGEQVRLSSTGTGQQLTFAMLDWPGYTAEINGHPVRLSHDKAGLLVAHLPTGARGTLQIGYRPPGLTVGLTSAGLGVLGMAGFLLLEARRKRRSTGRAVVDHPLDL